MSFCDLQSAPDLILEDGTAVTVCDRCRGTWGRSKKEPPCESCRVELKAENEEVAEIFMAVRGQQVTEIRLAENGMPYSVAVDLSIPAVESAIRMRGIKDQWACLQKVRRLWYAMREREG